MRIIKKVALLLVMLVAVVIAAFDIWGYLTLGTINPTDTAQYDDEANKVVMVFGATGSVGDGLLKAAIEDPTVEKVYVLSRRSSERIDAGVTSGKVTLYLHPDFTNYSEISEQLAEVNTVLWGLGTSSLQVDDSTYTLIHVDFPMAFLDAWITARTAAPMAFHFVAGVGTDPEGDDHWAREKGRIERQMAELAEGTGLRTFSYRSAYIRPASEQAHAFHYIGEALLKPGYLVITATELGQSMLEISARTEELKNGTLLDNLDSIRYAKLYQHRQF
ncbi:MAG: hypothetical protein V7746_02615 [Halioglobus sp.]